MRWSAARLEHAKRLAPGAWTRRVLAVLLSVCAVAAGAELANLAANASGTSTAARGVTSAAGTPATMCGRHDLPGTYNLRVAAQGRSRTVIVHVPPAYRSGQAEPLVLNLHGSGSSAAGQQSVTGMDASADQHHFIVAYPQAAIRYGRGYAWNVPGVPLANGRSAPRDAANDVDFLTGLAAQLGQRYCVDAHRVYVAGFSGGARMTSQLGCAGANVFAAIAPVSGLRMATPCRTAVPMAVIAFHGTADQSNPYDGAGARYWKYSVPAAEARWAAHDRCVGDPSVTQLSSTLALRSYAGCADQSAVELYTISGWGHQWPVDANAVMWSFFAAHPRR
jgi:polyhydroxybutyrate depolymerase